MATPTSDPGEAGQQLWLTTFSADQRDRLLDEDYRTAATIGVLLSSILVVGLITAVVAIVWTAYL